MPHLFSFPWTLCVFIYAHIGVHWCLQNVLEGLALKNHETEFLKSTGAVVQAVIRHDDGLHAQSDPRKWAYAAGY